MNLSWQTFGACLITGMLCSPFTALGEMDADRFVSGEWQIIYLLRDPHGNLVVSDVTGNSYSQHAKRIHRGYEVTVSVDLSPVHIQTPFNLNPESIGKIREIVPDPDDLLLKLKKTSRMTSAVREVLAWVDRSVRYEDNSEPLQDWKSALKKGSGNCVARADLTEEILGRLGIRTHPVSGCLINGNNGRFHRWIEIDYSGNGTYPSEIGLTQDFVEPNHLVIAPKAGLTEIPMKLSDLEVELEVIDKKREFWFIDEEQRPRGLNDGVIRLRVQPVQHHAALIGKIITPIRGDVSVDLNLNNKMFTTRVDESGLFSFTGLESGVYSLHVVPSWGYSTTSEGSLEPKEQHKVYVKIIEGL
ncbi:hypothetical protein JXA40_00330 [bacterium]|nr:hypothetical protein [candidate division CSSED10-310 bacterium]